MSGNHKSPLIIFSILIFLFIAYILFGCEVFGDTFLRISESQLLIDSKDGSKEFTISSNDNWKISCQEDWLSFSLIQGRGKQTIMINWKTNPQNDLRIGAFEVVYSDGKSRVTVEQESSPIQMINFSGKLENKAYGVSGSL